MATPLPNAERPTNRLAQETSPYLLQHQHNPVDWYPWGQEALARAKAEDKPILLSVGYSACHWCHVMERESFEDPAVAKLMNAQFVCVKVDREERPDVDAIYMQATLALRGQGGWPMNVFLTPELEPFFAGTYFPPDPRHGMPSWTTVLASLAEAWSERRDDVAKDAARLTEHLREAAAAKAPGAIGVEAIAAAAQQLAEEFDPKHGGFGSAPKFPRVEALLLLLRHHARTGDAAALTMATTTLRAMAQGGIYDQLGGGFARYSVDERWLVPHFEKMLYDNAALTKAYLAAYQASGEPLFHRVATETLDYVLREMTAPEGGFYSATDADSEGVEGKFFVWTPQEVEAVLGAEEARRFCAYYDVTAEGNFEGKSILNTPRSVEAVAGELGIEVPELQASLNAATEPMYRARFRRVAPGLDDKLLTAWNGLMIGALAEGARVLGDRKYLNAAEKAAAFVLSKLIKPDGRLLRSYCRGQAKFDAYLEDYAYLADALIDLYEAGGDRRHLAAAALLGEKLLEDFAPKGGGAFFFTAEGHEDLIVRSREGHDGATPNPNAVAAMALARLSYHLDMPPMREAARAAVETYGEAAKRMPRGFCQALSVIDFLHDGPVEVALVGQRGEPGFEALWAELGRRHLPNRLLALAPGTPGADDGLEPLPLLRDKTLVDGEAALYVCKGFACQAPITDAAAIGEALRVSHSPILLLDVMGTLVYDPFPAEVPAFFGVSLDELWALKAPGTWEAFERGELSESDLETRYFKARRCDVDGLKRALSTGYRWLDGIEALLSELSAAGVRMHALSNYPAWYRLIEERLGLSRYMPWSFVSADTGLRKPDPQAYLHAAQSLGVPPQGCLFVDDRAGNCEAARGVGMPAVHFLGAAQLRAALAAAGVPVDPDAR